MCTDLYWCVLACTDVYWLVVMCTDLYWCVLSCTDLYWLVLMCTDLYWLVLMCTDLYWLVLMCTDLYWLAPLLFQSFCFISVGRWCKELGIMAIASQCFLLCWRWAFEYINFKNLWIFNGCLMYGCLHPLPLAFMLPPQISGWFGQCSTSIFCDLFILVAWVASGF